MIEPTIEVPVSELGPVASKALKKLKERAENLWEEFIDDIMDRRWLSYGPKIFKNRERVEKMHGKVDGGTKIDPRTEYQKYFGDTRQLKVYRNLTELNKNRPDAVVTLLIEEYNVLMSWDDDE